MTSIRLVPRAALVALAALKEPLPEKHMRSRVDYCLGNLCTALSERLPDTDGLPGHLVSNLPDSGTAEWWLKQAKETRTALGNPEAVLEYCQNVRERTDRWIKDLESTGFTRKDSSELGRDAEALRYAREHERDTWTLVLAWEWLLGVDNRVSELEAVAQRYAENAANLPRANARGDGLEKPANTGNIEKLFHATIYADDLLARGFQSAKPKGRTGIGNFGAQATVSFTHSRAYATRLYRFLAAAWQVANGELDYARATALMGKGERFAELRPEKAQRHNKVAGVFDSDKKEKRQRTDHALSEFKRFCSDYSGSIDYLAVIGADQLYRQLLGVPYKSIAVLECRVDVSDAEYLAGELEFRVSPDKVLKVLRKVTG